MDSASRWTALACALAVAAFCPASHAADGDVLQEFHLAETLDDAMAVALRPAEQPAAEAQEEE